MRVMKRRIVKMVRIVTRRKIRVVDIVYYVVLYIIVLSNLLDQ